VPCTSTRIWQIDLLSCLQIYRAEFSCPAWFSNSARKLILKILDPNPKTVSIHVAFLVGVLLCKHLWQVQVLWNLSYQYRNLTTSYISERSLLTAAACILLSSTSCVGCCSVKLQHKSIGMSGLRKAIHLQSSVRRRMLTLMTLMQFSMSQQ